MVEVSADGERGVRDIDERVGEGDGGERRRGWTWFTKDKHGWWRWWKRGRFVTFRRTATATDGNKPKTERVEISVYVPENTSAKTVSVGFRANSCVVIDKSEGSNSGKTILQIDNLYNKIRPDECTWTIAGGSKKNEVCVSLAKVDAGETWPQLTTTTSSK